MILKLRKQNKVGELLRGIVSGFKPGSALSDPGRGQPMSLGPLGWSIMSSDGLVHPRRSSECI